MRYFIHILTDSERIADPEGAEFSSLDAARLEATQSARDLMAGKVMAGRTVPLGWRVQIADKYETILLTVPFATLVFADGDSYTHAPGPHVAGVTEPERSNWPKPLF